MNRRDKSKLQQLRKRLRRSAPRYGRYLRGDCFLVYPHPDAELVLLKEKFK